MTPEQARIVLAFDTARIARQLVTGYLSKASVVRATPAKKGGKAK